MRIKLILLIFILLVITLLTTYKSRESFFYFFFEDLIEIQVQDKSNQVIFEGTFQGTDLFVPAHFKCKCNYPINITISKLDSSSTLTESFNLKESLMRYSILRISTGDDQIKLKRKNRILRPIFQ